MHNNGEINTTLVVVREDGEVLGTVIVRDRYRFDSDGIACDDYVARVKRWIEDRPSPEAEILLFPVGRKPDVQDLNLILDKLDKAENLYN